MGSGKARLRPAACSVLAVLALAACAGAPSHPAGSTSATAAPAPGTAGCGPAPPRHAWAVELTTGGRTIWKTPLPTRNVDISPTVQPVLAGPVAVVAQDGVVRGLALADGRPLWSWTGGQTVYGMWRRGGLVAVLTDQVSDHSRLTGLDAATGAVRWSLRLPVRGLLGGQALTADGGLAMAVIGQGLQVVNLSDGRVRWRLHTAASPGLAAADGTVIYGLNGRLTGYDDRSGRPRWTITGGVPQDPALQTAAGLVLVTSNTQGPGIPNTLTAVIPATGRVAWRFAPEAPVTDPGAPVTVLSGGPAGLIVATYDPRRLYLLDSRTGRPRWHADTFVAQGTLPLVTGTVVVLAEGLNKVTIVDRDAADGRVRWRNSLPEPPAGSQQILQAGPLALLQGAPATSGRPAPLYAYRLAGGGQAWHAALPAFVEPVPEMVQGGILVQAADLFSACAVAGSTVYEPVRTGRALS
jgi:outer membrane protein assembly factor BamB